MKKGKSILRRSNSGDFNLMTYNNGKDERVDEEESSKKNLMKVDLVNRSNKRKCSGVKLTNKDSGNEFNIIFLERNSISKPNVQAPLLSHENRKSININQGFTHKNDSSELCNVEISSQSDISIRNQGINDFKAKFISTIAASQQILIGSGAAAAGIKTDDNDQFKEDKEKGEEYQNDNQLEKDSSILNNKFDPDIKRINSNNNDEIQLIPVNDIDNNNDNNDDLYQINLVISHNNSIVLSKKEEEDTISKKKVCFLIEDRNKNDAPYLSQEINMKEKEKEKEREKEYKTEFIFTQSHTSRRYKPNDILTNKSFIEMRYLNQNLRHISKIANTIKAKEPIVDEDNKQRNFYFYVDNRNVMKYTSFYWKKMDTAIFQFNNKQFEKAYKYLIEENIINSINEFSEVLILIQRFNKAAIGEFLSFDKSPNDKYKATQGFISKLDMQNEDLMVSLRFLLSLLLLPNHNWENIIKYFSITYYNDNKFSLSSYKSEEEVSKLCTFALELSKLKKNTNKAIKWNDFIVQYPDYNTINYQKIFYEIMSNPLPSCSFSSKIVYDEPFGNKDNVNQDAGTTVPHNNTNTKVITQKAIEGKYTGSELMTILKRGEVFRYRNIKGAVYYRIYSLSNDENIVVKNKTCSCFSLFFCRKIPIDTILHIFLGTSSMTHLEYENHITILTKNKVFELYNPSNEIILQWYNALSYLIKKTHSLNDLKQKQIKQINKSEYLSILWSEVVKNWEEYRELLKVKNKKAMIKKQTPRQKGTSNKTAHNESLASHISKEQIVNLCSLGLPNWIRRDLWKILIDNQLDISETLLAGYIEIIEEEKLHKPNSSILININNHINKLHQKYKAYIEINESQFKNNLYTIIRAFCLYRPDVLYSKEIAYFSFIFYIWSNDFTEAFISLCNFIVPNCFFKFLIKDEEMANEYSLFYNDLLKKYSPNVYKYLMKYNFHLNVFFAKWAGYLFATFFNYEIVLRIWDNFIFKGSIFIFEVALAIMILQEKDLLNSSNSTILENLRHFPQKYSENDLFELIDKIDITDDYEKHFNNYELGKEKGELFLNI